MKGIAMHRNTWTALVFIFALTALVATPAKADSGEFWNPDQPDESMCQDMTGNWVMCDSQGEDGISGGGSAPGMNSCTSIKGCKDCVVPDKSLTGKFECATLYFKSGYCKCGTTSQGGCVASGECTYVGR